MSPHVISLKQICNLSEGLEEGGLGGHMSYMHEDPSLTFGDIKKIFRTLASRKNNVIPVVEKVDGQNIFFTFNLRENRVRFARNKAHIQTGGIGREEIQAKWADAPRVQTAYTEAYDVLQQVLQGLNPKSLKAVFGEQGNNWFSAEVISEANPNVINYDGNHLVVHDSALVVGADGKAVPNTSPELYSSIVSLIGKKQAEVVKKNWQVHGQLVRQLSGVKDSKKFAEGFQVLNFLQAKYGLSDRSTVSDMILLAVKQAIPEIAEWPEEAQEWLAASEKKIELRKRKITELLDAEGILLGAKPRERIQALTALMARSEAAGQKATQDLGVGLELLTGQVMNDLDSILVANPSQEAARLRGEIQKISAEMQSSRMSPDIMAKLQGRFDRLGGVENIKSAIEGLVFRWKGNTYKLTYPFGVVNQILGLFRYGN